MLHVDCTTQLFSMFSSQSKSMGSTRDLHPCSFTPFELDSDLTSACSSPLRSSSLCRSRVPLRRFVFRSPPPAVYRSRATRQFCSSAAGPSSSFLLRTLTLVRGIGTDQNSQAIVSAFLSLTQGDEITIVNQNADDDISSFANGYHTHFEGFLLTRT